MPYNPQKHNRKSIRLKGYDYAQKGLYFVTICCQNHVHLFGHIEKGIMIYNDAGKMIAKWYVELENKFPDIVCREMIIMPNHFHCIIENVGADLRVCPNDTKLNKRPNDTKLNKRPDNTLGERSNDTLGARSNDTLGERSNDTLGARSNDTLGERSNDALGERSNNTLGARSNNTLGERSNDTLGARSNNTLGERSNNILGEHIGSPLHRVVQWFKTMTTNEYIRGVKKYDWQRFDKKLWQRNYWEHIIRNQNEYKFIREYILNNPQNWENDKLIK